ncbi:NAD(P)-dependent oxidoreductase [Phaeodactylibacter luteus]|uniref:SDR family oxidoreductase n=1 Tax=Phaeodactylibacter luteus TaxID=1564516 RepID=A0A5C6RMJ3_9BACT|nr:SDR family oxidoreductase [Phaeodactylibacter luteus]TXB62582.1 SDR family oxidoreductase [Phaeodactylibacter luteus]
MTIALFGGSGQTGRQFLRKALEAGHTVQALARTPSKIPHPQQGLTILQGDVLKAAEVRQAIKGADIVVSLFGQVKGSPPHLQTQGTRHIVQAMQQEGLQRIISLSGGGLPYPEKDQPKLADKLIRSIMKLAVPSLLQDAAGHHQVLKQSGLNWTIVRAPRLTNKPERGQYRVGWVGVNASTKIGRADLAAFILREVESPAFGRQMPFVSY